jgi:ParB family transcriptional regulator, chromosome partitioning protein
MVKTTFVKRSLTDLLTENENLSVGKEEVVDISLDLIAPNPYQPRKHFDETSLNELAESIRANGVLQPVIIKRVHNGFLLVAGERRCKAAKIAGFSTIPAIVRDYNDEYLAELALLENIQREDLTIVEEAEAYQNAITALNLTHMDLAKKIGKSRSYVSNTLGILTLPQAVIEEINHGNISMGHARALSKLRDVDRIHKIAEMIINGHLTVRDIESLVKTEKKKKEIKRRIVPENLSTGLKNTKQTLDESLNLTKPVKINENRLIIAFDSPEELAKFTALISKKGV